MQRRGSDILIIAGLLGLALPAGSRAAYQKITISGETASHGVFDCSVEYAPNSTTGYMAYSACDNWPVNIHTHLAKTTDHGLTWTFVREINTSAADTIDVSGTLTSGTWHHEVPTLVYDPDDPGKHWKLYWHRYFSRAPHNPATDSLWAFGWIAYRFAADPEGTWSGEIPLFGAGVFPPAPYTVQMNLNAGHAALSNMLVYTEPGGLYADGSLYLALQGNTASLSEQILFLIKSADQGASWAFVDVLANSRTAQALGYDYLTAPSLVAEAEHRFIFISPGWSATPDHDGTLIAEFEDLALGRLFKNGSQELMIYKSLAPSISTINAGESDYDAGNYNGGIIMPQLQLTPGVEFQLWNTFESLLATTTLTPTMTQTPISTATPAPAAASFQVLAYPNPGQGRITFRISREESTPAEAEVGIYNLAGERIACLAQSVGQEATLFWDSQQASPGIYLACIKINGQQKARIKLGLCGK